MSVSPSMNVSEGHWMNVSNNSFTSCTSPSGVGGGMYILAIHSEGEDSREEETVVTNDLNIQTV